MVAMVEMVLWEFQVDLVFLEGEECLVYMVLKVPEEILVRVALIPKAQKVTEVILEKMECRA
jgi:hypothetical protein